MSEAEESSSHIEEVHASEMPDAGPSPPTPDWGINDHQQTPEASGSPPAAPQPSTDRQQPSEEPFDLPLHGKELSDIFSRLSETLVYVIAPQDALIDTIVVTCNRLAEGFGDRINLEEYAQQLEMASKVNRILQAYRFRPKLYTLEERVLLTTANGLIRSWRDGLTKLHARFEAQQGNQKNQPQ